MSDQRYRSGGRRRSRGAGRNRYPSETRRQPAAPAKKQNLIDKILGFFRPKPAPRPAYTPISAASPQDGARPRSAQPNGTPDRIRRKPESVEVTSPKLYVGNLSFDASEGDLFELFNGVGKVQSAEVVSNRHTQRSKGYAFVTMQSIEEARRAVTELHDREFMGRKLVVSGAKTADAQRVATEA